MRYSKSKLLIKAMKRVKMGFAVLPIFCLVASGFGPPNPLAQVKGTASEGMSARSRFAAFHQHRLTEHAHQVHQLKIRANSHGDSEPVPIPGGDVIPPLIHQFVPGPVELGPPFEGVDVEPNGITNFRGFIAMAALAGTATDAAGNTFDLFSDIRVYEGEYVSADGSHHRGSFVEI